MKLCIYTHDATVVDRIRSIADEVERVELVEANVSITHDSWCVIVVENGPGAVVSDPLRHLRERAPLVPRVLVTTSGVTRYRGAMTDVDAVVDLRTLETDLLREVRRVRVGGIRALVRVAASVDAELLPLARRAVLVAARSPRPIRTVNALASSVGSSRWNVWNAWHRSLGGPRARLEDLLDWLLFLEAVSRKRRDVTWLDVAVQVGVHEHTLARLAARFADIGLRALTHAVDHCLADETVKAKLSWIFGEKTANKVG